MKIITVCGHGLGTSFMVEMNIKNILQELGVTGVEVDHSDLSSVGPGDADVFFLARDIADGGSHLGNVIVLDNIIDMDELKEKVTALMKEKNLI